MQNLSKKGMGQITAIVLLILIAVASIGIMWVAFGKTEVALSPAFSCFEMQTSPPINLVEACYNSETREVEVTIGRTFNDIYGETFELSIFSAGDSTTWSCGNTCGACFVPRKGEVETYFMGAGNLIDLEEVRINVLGCELGKVDIKDC
jgi:hypothetical protein